MPRVPQLADVECDVENPSTMCDDGTLDLLEATATAYNNAEGLAP